MGIILTELYPGFEIIHDRSIKSTGSRYRPDYYLPELGLVVEFNGYLHYSNPKTIIRDKKKKELYSNHNIKMVEIPYFVQLDNDTILHYFKIKTGLFPSVYPHGFVDSKAMLPAAFCTLGIERYIEEVEFLPIPVRDALLQSIQLKIQENSGEVDLVLFR